MKTQQIIAIMATFIYCENYRNYLVNLKDEDAPEEFDISNQEEEAVLTAFEIFIKSKEAAEDIEDIERERS